VAPAAPVALDELVPHAAGRSAGGVVSAADGQATLFAALLAVLGRIDGSAGAVLVLDDLHHAGASTLAWIRFAQRRGARSPLLVIASTRDRTTPLVEPDAQLHLGALDRAAVAALAGSAPDDRVDELWRRSGGHPLLLVELVAAPDDELPESIRAAVAVRRRELGEAGATIEAAAVVDQEVDLDLVAAVVGRSSLDVLADLEAGARGGVLEEQGAGFAFRHALVREALAANVSATRRALVHREAARHLAGRQGRATADPLEVAHHARLGGEPELAAGALITAAHTAVERFDYDEADRLLVDAIELHGTAEAQRQRGLVALATGRYEDAADLAQAALTLDGGAPALELAGWAAYYRRDFAGARRFAEQGARRATDPLIAAGCELIVGRVLHVNGDLRAADELLTAAVDHGGSHLHVGAVWLSALRMHQSRAPEALALLDGAAIAGAVGEHPFATIHADLNAGYAHALLGHADAALAMFERARERSRRQGQAARFGSRIDNWCGWVLRYLGAPDAADELNEIGREHAEANGLPEPHAHSLLDLADGCLQRGDAVGAAAWLDRAEPLHAGVHAMNWRHAMRAQVLRARLALLAGAADDVRELTASVRVAASERGVPRYAVFVDLIDALAALRSADAIDPVAVDATLRRLPDVAGLEAWWWTDALARAGGRDEWRRLADERGAELIAQAGERADVVRARLNGST